MKRIDEATRLEMLADVAHASRKLWLAKLAITDDVDGVRGLEIFELLDDAEAALHAAMARLPLEVLSPE
ncbi:MAG TPA: hypothetical protein VM013_01170 [Dehalococcoidia bacterium]|nr:hypothetical protein [Dehalococcoidia bacterium]